MNLPSRDNVSERLWRVAEHDITAEMICCDPLEPGHDLCARGYTALEVTKELFVDNPDAWKPAPVLDAVMELLGVQAQLSQKTEAPDAIVILAARHLDATEGPVQIGSTVDRSTRFALDQVLRYIAQAHNASNAPVEVCELPHRSDEEEKRCEEQRVSAQPVSAAYTRLQAAAHDASEAAHLHAMHGMKAVFQLCRRYGDQMIPTAWVLDALGLDENANTVDRTQTQQHETVLLGAAESEEKPAVNITPLDPDTLDADEEVEQTEKPKDGRKGWGGMRGE